jgi:hypothetical protein
VRHTCSHAAPASRPREHEGAQRLERFVDLVAARFEPFDLRRLNTQTLALILGGTEVGAEVEQVVLDPPQPLDGARRHSGLRQRDADLRAELVDRPVGLDPRVVLGTRLRSPRCVSPPSPSLV